MRNALILLNCILVLLLCGSVFRLVYRNGAGGKTHYTVKKRTGKAAAGPRSVSSAKVREEIRKSPEEIRKTLMEKNVFDPNRCAAAVNGSVRTTMTLVGTFRAGDFQGAVILQKGTSNSNPGFFGGPPPGMMGGGGRRQGFSSGGRSGRGNNAGNRDAMPMMPPPPGMMNRFAAGNQNKSTSTVKRFKQYVRVGETLENGYKLIEVTRTSAILTRGGEKLELEIQEASKNIPASSSRRNNNRGNATQQALQNVMRGLQNMQRQQGFQNMQMMRMMQQNMNNQPAGGNGGRRRR